MRPGFAAASGLLLAALALLGVQAPAAQAAAPFDEPAAVILDHPLPFDASGAAAVWTGEAAYIFAGDEGKGAPGFVARFDPVTGNATLLNVTMPEPRQGHAVAWDGRFVYVVGGVTPVELPGGGMTAEPTPNLLRFDPRNETLEVLDAAVPWYSAVTVAAWDGQRIIAVGACASRASYERCHVMRYDPVAQEMAYGVDQHDDPATMLHTDGGGAFVAGRLWLIGEARPGDPSGSRDAIRVYDPANDTMVTSPHRLVESRIGATVAAAGPHILVLGGHNGTFESGGSWSTSVLVFDPATGAFAHACARLPAIHARGSAVYADPYLYLFGTNTATGRNVTRLHVPAFDCPELAKAGLTGYPKVAAPAVQAQHQPTSATGSASSPRPEAWPAPGAAAVGLVLCLLGIAAARRRVIP